MSADLDPQAWNGKKPNYVNENDGLPYSEDRHTLILKIQKLD